MTKLNKTNFILKVRRGLRATLNQNVNVTFANYPGIPEGEMAYTTDDKNLWICDTVTYQPVQTLNLAVSNNDEIVIDNDEVVYNI